MPQKKQKPEEIVANLRQVDVLASQGLPVAEAVRSIGVSQFSYYRWREEFGEHKMDLPGKSGEHQLRNQEVFYGEREQTRRRSFGVKLCGWH